MSKTKILIFLFTILNFAELAHCQVYLEWLNQYDGIIANVSACSEIKTDNNGNIYILGKNNNDILLLKFDENGNQIWSGRYNGPGNGNDLSSSLKIYKNNKIYLTGSSPGGASGYDYVTMKYDSVGNREWVIRFSSHGNYTDASYALSIDNEGNAYVTGESYNDSLSSIDCITIKYNSNGVQQWMAKYISGNAIGYAIESDNLGNVYVTGRSNGVFFTVKYNISGIQKWISFYDGPYGVDNAATEIGLDSLNNIFVSGVSIGDGHYWDFATVKYNSLGVEQWVKRYNGSANYMDQVRDMKVDKKGNVFVTGNGTQTGRGYDFTTIKYNTAGDEVWVAKYHNGLNDIATALTLDDFGNVFVTGQSDGSGTKSDYATVKYDSVGNQLWVNRNNFSPQHEDQPVSIAVDMKNNVYIAGMVFIWGQQHYDIVTIKYSQNLVGINPANSHLSIQYNLSQNYPNPFNPSTNIKFSVAQSSENVLSNVKISVFNNLGKELVQLLNEKKTPGNYEVNFKGDNLPSGIYFYKLEVNGNVIDTKRMILLK